MNSVPAHSFGLLFERLFHRWLHGTFLGSNLQFGHCLLKGKDLHPFWWLEETMRSEMTTTGIVCRHRVKFAIFNPFWSWGDKSACNRLKSLHLVNSILFSAGLHWSNNTGQRSKLSKHHSCCCIYCSSRPSEAIRARFWRFWTWTTLTLGVNDFTFLPCDVGG